MRRITIKLSDKIYQKLWARVRESDGNLHRIVKQAIVSFLEAEKKAKPQRRAHKPPEPEMDFGFYGNLTLKRFRSELRDTWPPEELSKAARIDPDTIRRKCREVFGTDDPLAIEDQLRSRDS